MAQNKPVIARRVVVCGPDTDFPAEHAAGSAQPRDIQQHDAVHRWLDKVNACIESVRKYDSTRNALCEQLGYLDDECEIAIFRMQAELRDKADMAKKLFQFLAMNADKLTQIEGFEDLFDAADDSCVEMVSPPESENSSTAGQECSLFD